MRTEPIRILLNGLGAVVDLILVALVALGILDLDLAQIAAVVAAVSGVCALLAEVLRAAVVSPSTAERWKEEAIEGEVITLEQSFEPLELDVDTLASAVVAKMRVTPPG